MKIISDALFFAELIQQENYCYRCRHSRSEKPDGSEWHCSIKNAPVRSTSTCPKWEPHPGFEVCELLSTD